MKTRMRSFKKLPDTGRSHPITEDFNYGRLNIYVLYVMV